MDYDEATRWDTLLKLTANNAARLESIDLKLSKLLKEDVKENNETEE